MALHAVLCRLAGAPPEAEWQDFAARFRMRALAKAEHFVRAGEEPESIGFVCSGLLRMYYTRRDGKEFIKSFVRPLDFVAALEALIAGSPSRLAIQCLEPTSLLVIPHQAARGFFATSAYWERFGRLLVERLYVKKAQREAAFLMDSVTERYAQFEQEYADVAQRVPDYQIASYLGVTPEALSRLRARRARRS